MLNAALIVYYLIAMGLIAYAYWARHQSYMFLSLMFVMVLIPFAGIFIVWIAVAPYKQHLDNQITSFTEITELSGFTNEGLMSVNVNKESNVIPLEDALTVNDHRTRRRAVLDVLKEESVDMIPLLTKAVQNEDTETSHYAVAAIMELKRVMMSELQKQSVLYELHPHDPDQLSAISAVLKYYLGAGLMDQRLERRYRNLHGEVLDSLVSIETCEEVHYVDKVECEMMLGRYDKAREASERFLEKYPSSESAYYVQLKLWYRIRSGLRFNQTMELLKQSPIKISQRTLELIRYWQMGEQHV
ncbi:hypothetical protein D3C73_655930 [compost metagenome]